MHLFGLEQSGFSHLSGFVLTNHIYSAHAVHFSLPSDFIFRLISLVSHVWVYEEFIRYI